MREDCEDKLSAMFPEGCIVVYVCKDDQVRCNMFNPHGYKELFAIHDKIAPGTDA